MPYYVQKSGKQSWQLIYRYSKERPRNVQKHSPEAASLGFRPEMTLEHARTHAAKLQVQEALKREAGAHARAAKGKKLRSAYLTDADAEEFERVWLPEYKIRSAHWNTMQKIIVGVALHPEDWFEQRNKLYAEFQRLSMSAAYAKKLLRYLNFWGYFICKKQRRAFMKVSGLDGTWKNRLEARRKTNGSSRPLSPQLLQSKRKQIADEHYNWLLVSVWFGLRPREVDNLREKNPDLWFIDQDKQGRVLHVFQEKLFERGVPKDDCWKAIPCEFPEQASVLDIILSGKLKKPIGKGGRFMRETFGAGFSHYAGRNNFSGMLRDAGYDLETRRHWMGHLSIKTTEAYDQKTQRGKVFRPKKAA